MAAFVGLGKDQHGVGLGEVVVTGKEGVPVLGGGREGGTADLGGGHVQVHHPVGDVIGDELDQFGIAGYTALGHKVIQVEVALHLHGIDRAVQVVVVAFPQHLDAGHRADLVMPDGPDARKGQHQQYHDHGQYREQDLFYTSFGFGCYRIHTLIFLSSFLLFRDALVGQGAQILGDGTQSFIENGPFLVAQVFSPCLHRP